MLRGLRNRLIEYPLIDVLLTVMFLGIHVAMVWQWHRFDLLRTTGFSNRLSLYTDTITVTGIFVGFAGAALASYLAFSGQRVEALRARVGAKILRQWLSAIVGPSIAIAVLIAVKALDRDGTTASGVRWLAEAALIFTAMRVTRMLYVYIRLVQVATTPPAVRSSRNTPIGIRKLG